ncbi:Uracil permease [anaerobic digester metagenome]
MLYGMIGTSGLRILVDSKVNYDKSKNIALTSVIFVVGLSGISINLGTVALRGMSLAALVAMALSLLFYFFDKMGIMNDN